MPQSKKITLLQFDGKMSKKEFDEAIDLGLEGIKPIYKLQQEAIKAKFAGGEQPEGGIQEEQGDD